MSADAFQSVISERLAAAWLLVCSKRLSSPSASACYSALLLSLLSTLVAEQGLPRRCSGMSGAQDPQPDSSAQSGGYAAADSSWWNGWGSANSSYWSWPGQQWSSYGGNGWSSHGSDKWQSGGWGSQWSEDAWKAKQWGGDSDAWQKDRREESSDARPAGVPPSRVKTMRLRGDSLPLRWRMTPGRLKAQAL